jgi:hypothetical protein
MCSSVPSNNRLLQAGLLLLVSVLARSTVVAAQPSTAPAAATPESYALARGVVVAPSLDSVFVLSDREGGAISILDMHTLRARMTFNNGILPLIVVHGRLLALQSAGSPLRLVWLDAKSLRVVAPCAPVRLPDGIRASAVDGLGSRVELSAAADADAVYVRYHASAQYIGGVPPSAEQQANASRELRGVVRVGWTGATESVASAPKGVEAPATFGLETPYQAGPFEVAGLTLKIDTVSRGSDVTSVRITRQRAGDAKPMSPLDVRTPAGLAIVSLERSALLVAEAGGKQTITHARIVATDTGRALGRVPVADIPGTFLRHDAQVLFVSGGELRAFDLPGGASHAYKLPSVTYQGSYPPSTPPAAHP